MKIRCLLALLLFCGMLCLAEESKTEKRSTVLDQDVCRTESEIQDLSDLTDTSMQQHLTDILNNSIIEQCTILNDGLHPVLLARILTNLVDVMKDWDKTRAQSLVQQFNASVENIHLETVSVEEGTGEQEKTEEEQQAGEQQQAENEEGAGEEQEQGQGEGKTTGETKTSDSKGETSSGSTTNTVQIQIGGVSTVDPAGGASFNNVQINNEIPFEKPTISGGATK